MAMRCWARNSEAACLTGIMRPRWPSPARRGSRHWSPDRGPIVLPSGRGADKGCARDGRPFPFRPVPSLRTPSRVVAGLLLGAALSSCTSFVSGMGDSANAALEEALRVGVEGFQTADAPAPPTEICESSSDPAPEVDATLRPPASAGYTDGDAELHAWAWRTTSSEQAARIVDRAVDGSGACEQGLYAAYATAGAGTRAP